MTETFYEKIAGCFEKLDMAATRVALNDQGVVECRALSVEELGQLLDLYDDISEIPDVYIIYDREGNKLSKPYNLK